MSATRPRAAALLLGALTMAGAVAGCGGGAGDGGSVDAEVVVPWTDGRCNGAAELCDRRYDQVAYPTTHNAMSNADAQWVAPNQQHGLTRQLGDGIRGLMLDMYIEQGDAKLCHASCLLGSQLLADGLGEIVHFLRAHPGEVITIIVEPGDGFDDADIQAAFAGAGLEPYVHTQAVGAPWPTLREMITSGHRVVVFTQRRDGSVPWYLDQWAFTWETPYSFKNAGEFTCVRDRGTRGNALYTVNHFLGNPLPDPTLAEMVNHDPVLSDRIAKCRTEGQFPNFVAVDFYDIGDLLPAIRALNGLPR